MGEPPTVIATMDEICGARLSANTPDALLWDIIDLFKGNQHEEKATYTDRINVIYNVGIAKKCWCKSKMKCMCRTSVTSIGFTYCPNTHNYQAEYVQQPPRPLSDGDSYYVYGA